MIRTHVAGARWTGLLAISVVTLLMPGCATSRDTSDVASGDEPTGMKADPSGETTSSSPGNTFPDGFYFAVPVPETGDRRAERSRGQEMAARAKESGYAEASLLFDNANTEECLTSSPDAMGNVTEACGLGSPSYIVVLEGPFDELDPPKSRGSQEDASAFAKRHEEIRTQAQQRASERALPFTPVLGFFRVAGGEPPR